ncbi:DUF5675 family protein [Burkholderia cepacia]|uniref:DUF5675 family protein n=1 Tax=Burkholderia cepacia TaxID=292 RepID=UPI00264E3B2D|nr:DUF5675 family protein [Burkholderia cepacia]MDN7909076.1 DUF5675 family protein [Burkholderia cepacia]
MKRRKFVSWATGSALLPMPWRPSRAQGGSVRLLMVREQGYQNKCLPCVAGKLYGVPGGIDLASAEHALGLLTLIADTVELSYEPDSAHPSSIPEGTYNATVRADGTKKWMWTGGQVGMGLIRQSRAWRIELKEVPHRTAIQFHYGLDASWSRGCIILGHQAPACPKKGPCSFSDSPERAVLALRKYVETNSIASNTPIVVRFAAA